MLKQKRHSISPVQQHISGIKTAIRAKPFIKGREIASYQSFNSELPTRHLHKQLLRKNKNVYLPLLQHNYQLAFIKLAPFCQTQANQYGIAEPRYTKQRAINVQRINCIITPLVGFDARCNRIGMSGGYYDRLLAAPAFKNTPSIGLAYKAQQISHIKAEAWDQPLSKVITPRLSFIRLRQK